MAITVSFRGTSRDELYSGFGLESLADGQFYRRIIAFYKIINKKDPQYLIDYLPTQDFTFINLRKGPAIYPWDTKTERYPNSSFLYCFSQCCYLNLLDQSIVLVDLLMINRTPNIFYFRFIFSAFFIFKLI